MTDSRKMSSKLPPPSAGLSHQGTMSGRTATNMTEDDAVDPSLTICKLCNKELSAPKHFPCIHTYCESCVRKHAKSLRDADPGTQIRCPECMVPVPNSADVDMEKVVRNMPSNSLLQSHIIAKQIKTKMCKPCQRLSKSTNATSWCTECLEAMCDACVDTHGSIQFSDQHKVVDIQETESNPNVTRKKLKCTDHPREEIVKFCMEHQQACCNRCKTSVHSACTSFLPVERAVEAMRRKQELPVLISHLDTMSSNVSKIVNERKEAITAIDTQRKDGENNIKELRDKVNKHLDELEKALHEDFQQKHQVEVAQINQDLEIFEQKNEQIELYKKLLLSASKNSIPQVTALTEGAKIRQQCQLLEESLQHRAGKIVRAEYEVKESDVINDMQTLGTVELRHVPLHSNKPIEHALRGNRGTAVKVVVEKRNNFLALKYQSSFITGGKLYGTNILLVDNKGREVRGYSEAGLRQDMQVCSLYGNPWDVAILPKNKKGNTLLAVTIPMSKTIQLLEMGPQRMTQVERGGHFITSEKCFGIAHMNGNVLVACMRTIEVWDVEPDLKLTFNNVMRIQGAKVKYLCAADENRLYYSDSDFKGSLYCITADGSLIFRYSHRSLRVPMGISVDDKGHVFVAGHHSNNIHMVSPQGVLIQVIHPDDEGFKKPIILISDAEKLYLSYENHTITHLYPSLVSPRDSKATSNGTPADSNTDGAF